MENTSGRLGDTDRGRQSVKSDSYQKEENKEIRTGELDGANWPLPFILPLVECYAAFCAVRWQMSYKPLRRTVTVAELAKDGTFVGF